MREIQRKATTKTIRRTFNRPMKTMMEDSHLISRLNPKNHRLNLKLKTSIRDLTTFRTIWYLMVLGLMGRQHSKRMSKYSNRPLRMKWKTATSRIVPTNIQGKEMIKKRVQDDLLQQIHNPCHRKNTWSSTNSRILMIIQSILRTQWRKRFGVSSRRKGSFTWSKQLLTCSPKWCWLNRGAPSARWLPHANTTKITLKFCKKGLQSYLKENSNSICHPKKGK